MIILRDKDAVSGRCYNYVRNPRSTHWNPGHILVVKDNLRIDSANLRLTEDLGTIWPGYVSHEHSMNGKHHVDNLAHYARRHARNSSRLYVIEFVRVLEQQGIIKVGHMRKLHGEYSKIKSERMKNQKERMEESKKRREEWEKRREEREGQRQRVEAQSNGWWGWRRGGEAPVPGQWDPNAFQGMGGQGGHNGMHGQWVNGGHGANGIPSTGFAGQPGVASQDWGYVPAAAGAAPAAALPPAHNRHSRPAIVVDDTNASIRSGRSNRSRKSYQSAHSRHEEDDHLESKRPRRRGRKTDHDAHGESGRREKSTHSVRSGVSARSDHLGPDHAQRRGRRVNHDAHHENARRDRSAHSTLSAKSARSHASTASRRSTASRKSAQSAASRRGARPAARGRARTWGRGPPAGRPGCGSVGGLSSLMRAMSFGGNKSRGRRF